MSKNIFKEDRMSLIVSLPKNDYNFAKAAWENGADAIKVHINANHFASGTVFKSINEEMVNLEKILKDSPVPVGVVIGDNSEAIVEDFESVLKHNFAFMSVYYDHAPIEILNQETLYKTVALNSNFKFSEISALEQIGIQALELSILDHSEYRKLLTVKDVAMYKDIINATNLPVIIPTQKKVRLSDINTLQSIGVKALMIGAVITGNELSSFGTYVKDYANKIKAL